MIERFVALLMLSRDAAHKQHWATTSYSTHKALDSFYSSLVGLMDSFVEMYQGRHGRLGTIPTMDEKEMTDPVKMLKKHLKWIEESRYQAVDKADTALQNQIDEIVGLYLETLYQLSLQ